MAQQNGQNGHNAQANGAFDELIGALYDTAIATNDECAWCSFLPKVCGAFNATAGGFVIHDFVSRAGSLCAASATPGRDSGPCGSSDIWIARAMRSSSSASCTAMAKA